MSDLDLQRLAHPDPNIAAEAFERLSAKSGPGLNSHLARRYGCPSEERDEVIALTFERVWAARLRFQPEGNAAWEKYLRTIARNCLLDEWRKRSDRQTLSLEDAREIPDEDMPYLNTLLEKAENWKRLNEAADALWLGEAEKDSDRRVLAALLFYGGLPVDEVAKLVKTNNCDEWLLDRPTLLRLAFTRLYFSNRRLAAYLLKIDVNEMDTFARDANRTDSGPSVAGWTWAEIRFIVARVYNAMMSEQIRRLKWYRFSHSEANDLLARCIAKYPMPEEARYLTRVLPNPRLLIDDGLWKRLAFEYYVKDSLPQKHIHERMAGAADAVGHRVTEPMIAGWFSVGRLFAALAVYWEQKTCD